MVRAEELSPSYDKAVPVSLMAGEVGAMGEVGASGGGVWYVRLIQSIMKQVMAERQKDVSTWGLNAQERRWRDLLPRFTGSALISWTICTIPSSTPTRWTDNHE